MTGFVGAEFTDQAVAQQVQVAHRIQYFVAYEFILVTQAFPVEYPVLVDDDRVVHAAAARQALGAQILDLMHKTEGAGPTDLALE